MADETPKSINLLEPVNPPEDVWTNLYDWLFNIGKYLLILVQVVVLMVFFARFVLDRNNNDLTIDINERVERLNDPFYRKNAISYQNYNILFGDIQTLNEDQIKNSTTFASMIETVPTDIELLSLNFYEDSVSLHAITDDYESFDNYESLLRKNNNYNQENMRIDHERIDSAGGNIEFTVTFDLARKEVQE
jgi:hypothetical protein